MSTRPVAAIALVIAITATVGIITLRTTAQTSTPAVPCEDSDGGVNLAAKGVTKGFHAMDGQYFSAIYGTEPDPGIPKKTTDNFSILYDYCYLSDGVVEGECIDGKLTSYGHNCPNGCSDGACKSAPADASPSITLSVQATSPTTWRPGGRGYFSWSVADDKALQSVIITTSQMMYSSPQIDETWKCQGKTSCGEKVYTIVPSNPGPQFVTVTATDSAGQTATQTVNFDAPACTTDADCGGGSTQWAGATFCGLPDSSGLNSAVMQYGVVATCGGAGVCDTSSKALVKQQCAVGEVCGSYTSPMCMAKPQACVPNGEITSPCSCGALTVVPPSYWERFCCVNYFNGLLSTSPHICPPAPSISSSSLHSSSPLPSSSPPFAPGSVPSPSSAAAGETNVHQVTTSPVPQAAAPSTTPVTPSPGARPAAQPAPRPATEGVAQGDAEAKEKHMSKAATKREWDSLKGKVNTTKKKLASVERNIASLEKKIDAKLRLLDRVKRKDVQKRVTVQIEKWEKKVESFEEKKEKLERTLDELQETWGQMQDSPFSQ